MKIDLRSFFRVLNRFMVLLWRLGLGPWIKIWPEVGGWIMVINHTGRVSGKLYRTPVNFARVQDTVYCLAGFGKGSDWYRNLLAHPEIEIWLPDECWKGVAQEVTDPGERFSMMRQVLIASGFAAYLAGINPHRLTDDELEQLTASYRLLRIRQVAECSDLTGQVKPGDLAWVWPLVAFALLPVLLRRRRQRK